MKIKSYELKLNRFDPNRLQKAQQYVDREILRRSDPYVPFKTGMLKRSGILGTKIGTGVIEYTVPYARRQYFKGRAISQRGRLWTRRMWISHSTDIIKNAQKFIIKG